MKLNVEEAANLLSMLNSSDEDNKYLAFKAIEAHDFRGADFGYLVYLYKFSKASLEDWKKHAGAAYKTLTSSVDDALNALTYARGLTILIEKRADQKIINMYLESHTKALKEILNLMGYPMKDLDLIISMKEYE